MARPLRIEYPGGLYHVTSRGNAGSKIFRNDKDRLSFLEVLNTNTERFHWICHAYCLMDNHYHLIVETPEGNLSRAMRYLNGVYTQRMNRKYGKMGHLFQGRYKAILIDREGYLLELCRYVVLNPIRAHLVKKPEGWRWSSYRATAGFEDSPQFLTTDWILGQFGERRKRAQSLYRMFVMEGIAKESPWRDLKGQIFLGDKTFIEKLRTPGSSDLKEIPSPQRYASRPTLQEWFLTERVGDRVLRNKAIYSAYVDYGYRLKEIAEYLRVHYATVSRTVKAVESKNV